MISGIVKAFDAHPPRKTSAHEKGTVHGGLCTCLVFFLFLFFVVYYLQGVFSDSYSLVASTSVLPFPDSAADADEYLLPEATCIAPGGCWVRSQVAIVDGDPGRCIYVAPYESLPEPARNIYLETDPTDSLTVLWDEATNFGISYDFEKITDSLRGTSTTVARSQGMLTTSDAQTKKLSPGSALFLLTRATTAASALSFLQKTFDLTSWQHITMSTEGTTTATGGGCEAHKKKRACKQDETCKWKSKKRKCQAKKPPIDCTALKKKKCKAKKNKKSCRWNKKAKPKACEAK